MAGALRTEAQVQNEAVPITRDLVLVGGGHAHALVLRKFGMRPVPGLRITLIDPNPAAPYTGMLPGHIAGHYDRAALEIDLVRLARFAGARLILGAVDGIDPERRLIHVQGRPAIPYDVASLDIGIGSAPVAVSGFAEYGVAAKPLGPFAERWGAFLSQVSAGDTVDICVLGAGVGGVELSMAMVHAVTQRGAIAQMTVLDRSEALQGLTARAQSQLRRRLGEMGIALRERTPVSQVSRDAVLLDDGTKIPAQIVVGVAGAQPAPWLAETGLNLTDGYITVGPDLRATGHPTLYAAGDIAHLSHAPRPKAGVYAVRAAPILAHNLRAQLTGTGTKKTYRPQADYLKLISLGEKSALLDKWGVTLQGRWLWRWKDRIDRRFMDRFQALPEMAQSRLPSGAASGVAETLAGAPPCGGCGSKVSGAALTRVLGTLPSPQSPDVMSAPGDDSAILRSGDGFQVISTDHLRAFTLDPHLMARIAAIHALGDVWAMGATPQAALAQVILPRLAEDKQRDWLAEIMDAAGSVFAEAGAAIVGGHSSVGAELTLGFTVTGLCKDTPITLSGAQPGDALILTKPLGSGTIMAAEMQGKARGRWVAAAFDAMAQPQGKAAACLSHAHAMTDVTGFGLAGHLLGLCRASGVGADLWLGAVPLMTGARELAETGIRSTLYPQNLAYTAGGITAPTSPETALLHDPQTAGGLLAAIPAVTAPETLAALSEAGYPAAQIGVITDAPPGIVCI